MLVSREQTNGLVWTGHAALCFVLGEELILVRCRHLFALQVLLFHNPSKA